MKAPAAEDARSLPAVRAADLVELTKPGITSMVVLTAGLGFLLASHGALDWALLLHTLLGTALVSGGASALNHVLERDVDALMRRTAARPIPAGRLDPDLGLLFGIGLAIAGLAELALAVDPLAALLGAVALAGYVFVYTPMKRRSSLATVVGAVPGALPPMMGWAAVRGGLEPGAWVLFGILFLWQLPHFLSIAWLCRDDYARAGLPMLPVADSAGRRTARQMVLWGSALVPMSLGPAVMGLAGPTYLLGSFALGLGFLGCCLGFARRPGAPAARRLLLASVVYLPAVLAVMVLDRVV